MIFAWFAGFIFFTCSIADTATSAQTRADAIVVLTGGRNRLKEAFKLLNEGKADNIFISGVFKDTTLKELQEREDVQILNSSQVVLDKKATNTVENAKEAGIWVKQNNISSIYLVTSNYHLPRSITEFKHYTPDLEIKPYPVFSENVSKHWWKNRKSFFLLAGEYNKLLYVWLKNNLKASRKE